jgi:hypothetical protein
LLLLLLLPDFQNLCQSIVVDVLVETAAVDEAATFDAVAVIVATVVDVVVGVVLLSYIS